MNNIFRKSLFAGAAAAILSMAGGCTNLDETVYDQLPGDGSYTYTDEEMAQQYGNIYDRLRDMYDGWEGYQDISQECGDLLMTPFRYETSGWGVQYVSLHKHEFHSSIAHLYRPWYSAYQGINYCNSLLDNPAFGDVPEVAAELRTFRALFYYVLFDLWRNIPVTDTNNVEPGFMPEQWEPSKTYDWIIKELTESKPNLSKEKRVGQIDYWCACMILAKMYLNHDAWFPETPDSNFYKKACDEVNDVIRNGGYTLADNYRDPFSASNTNCPEIILGLMYQNKYAGHGTNHFCKWFIAGSQDIFGVTFDPWNGSACVPQFLATYDPADTRKTDTWKWGPQVDLNGDPIYINGKELNFTPEVYAIEHPGAAGMQGARLWLYEIEPGNIGTSNCNIPFFRLTDAYFIKAECLLRLGGYDGETEQDAADIVTMIRRRAFKNNPEKAVRTVAQLKGGSVYDYGLREIQGDINEDGELINVVNTETHEGGADILLGGLLDDLAWEFVYEHHRRQDLIRFKMTNGCNVFNGKSWFGKAAFTNPKDHHFDIFPILRDNLQANPKLKQNPGYSN